VGRAQLRRHRGGIRTTVTVGGILLTGGASRRLGTDKATLVFDGVTLADRGAAALRAAGLVAVEVGPGYTDLPTVRENPAGSGPLAALVAGFGALADLIDTPPDAVVLLACDLPNAAEALGALLAAPAADVVVPIDGAGRAQYVCARYGAALVSRAADLVAAGERSLRALVATVPAARRADVTDLPAAALADIDTETDARRWGVELPR
jgi:molybdopterin-guanine dinucleotide biosynthesis protein A